MLARADVSQATDDAHYPAKGVADDVGTVGNVHPVASAVPHAIFQLEASAARLQVGNDLRSNPDQIIRMDVLAPPSSSGLCFQPADTKDSAETT